jgi:hypothetical protein
VVRASTARAAPAADEHVAAVGDVRAVGCHSGQGAPLSQQVSLLQDHCPLHVSASRPSPPGAAQHHDPVSTFFVFNLSCMSVLSKEMPNNIIFVNSSKHEIHKFKAKITAQYSFTECYSVDDE